LDKLVCIFVGNVCGGGDGGMTSGKKHEHYFKLVEKKVTLRHGKAVDTLKQWVCKCGKTETFNLERTKQ
jgi:hypothetical protein